MSKTHENHVPDTPTLDAARAHFEKFLRTKDLRLTSQRRDILDRAAAMGRHFTADELADAFRARRVRPSKATVYRTLSLLTESSILEEHEFKKRESSVYEFAWGREHHDHLICIACGKIEEFFSQAIEDLQDAVAKDHGFEPRFHSQKIYGECRACRKTAK